MDEDARSRETDRMWLTLSIGRQSRVDDLQTSMQLIIIHLWKMLKPVTKFRHLALQYRSMVMFTLRSSPKGNSELS